ncbi:hypothetical protein N657DRAFT_583004 [Parathielavia appendiculata]|uniref:Nucleoside 2-deoxyribosyltransferase n=1 Tax=Parathielavia appendiculata TaxID=2587402 RepID=A0AAN6YYF3_9PEZI|nr:hypothetical protein N657DRAFT_583004 [Parathielavia appendiculata]
MEDAQRQSQIVHAPSRPAIVGKVSIFLAGTTTKTSGSDWREALTEVLGHLPITIFNPLRPDWDSTWLEDVTFAPFRKQVEWELDMQEQADVVIVYFGPGTDAPISLLEFGLCARARKALVVCNGEYRRRGNVQIVCQRLAIEYLDAEDDWTAAVIRRVEGLLGQMAQSGY